MKFIKVIDKTHSLVYINVNRIICVESDSQYNTKIIVGTSGWGDAFIHTTYTAPYVMALIEETQNEEA